jgi:uncharacterized integral membrane protein
MADKGRRRGSSLGFVVGFGVGIPATIFALSNLEATSVEFLGWQAEVPLWAVMAISLLAGVLLGIAGLLTWQARRRRGRKKAARSAGTETADPAQVDAVDAAQDRPEPAEPQTPGAATDPPDGSAH